MLLAASISTGLDQIVDLIESDPGLQYHVATSDRREAAAAAQRMNEIIVTAIQDTGVANNAQISAADVRDLNAYIRGHYQEEWVLLHGDDEDSLETGFHLVQNNGANTYWFGGYNAIDTVADGIYHLGFEIYSNRLLNEDGEANASLTSVADWLQTLLRDDLAAGTLVTDVVAYPEGTTGTGLDSLVNIITVDPGLQSRISTTEIATAARAADQMGHWIVESIVATGAANDDVIDAADVQDINAYLQTNYSLPWAEQHGDDEEDQETGFHLVQYDGAQTRLFSQNAVDTVADGIYHLGFPIEYDRLLNEDGNRNAHIASVAFWLNELLAEDLAGTGLDNPALAPQLAEIQSSEVYHLDSLTMNEPDDHLEIAHDESFELPNGTIALRFTADDVTTKQALFSKDAKYYGDGGHITAFLRDGRVEVRLQSDSQSYTLYSYYTLIRPGETHHVAINFGAEGFQLYIDGQLEKANVEYTGGIDGNQETLAIGANIWARDSRYPNWTADFFQGTISDFGIYNRALSRAEISLLAGDVQLPASPLATTHTGLDDLVHMITNDAGLNRRVPLDDINTAAVAADQMNHLILEAIVATGTANDGQLNAADLRDVNQWLRAHHAVQWIDLHGDDEDGVETGFHLVQNDGATTKLFGTYNAVDTVADGIYHLGFEVNGYRLRNEDGNDNASLESVAFWLSELLQEDLASGQLNNPDIPSFPGGTTNTGLDQLVGIIVEDAGLQKYVATSEILAGAGFADQMNTIIVEAIRATGVANNGQINEADVREINSYIRAHYAPQWVELHGDDEDCEETGFHLVQNDGASTVLYNRNAVNTVADGIYHLGFEIDGYQILNEDGNRNASLKSLAYWLGDLLRVELADGSLANAAVPAYAQGTTETGLDQLVTIIAEDRGLNYRIATSEITAGATFADQMNTIILEAIQTMGLANDGEIDTWDVYDINSFIQTHYAAAWVELHGDDEDCEETGFHLVQNDGATSRLFGGYNAVDTVADGIYHLGFDIDNGRLLNEDGNRNASVESVAFWLNSLLADDLQDGSLFNVDQEPDLESVAGSVVYELEHLEMTAPEDYLEIAHQTEFEVHNGSIALTFNAAEVGERMALFSKDASGYAAGGHITAFLQNGYVEVRLQSTDQSVTLRSKFPLIRAGETHHLAVTFGDEGFRLYVDGHLEALKEEFTVGLESNEETLAIGANIWARSDYRQTWNDDHFAGTIDNFAIYDRALTRAEVAALGGQVATPPPTYGVTRTGLDKLVDIIVNDPGLNHKVALDDIFAAADAANAMNELIVAGIRATGAARDGDISMGDVRDLNRYLQQNYLAAWAELHGDDECDAEWGFHLVQNDGAITQMFGGHNAVNTVADGLYHMGFDIQCNQFLNEDGNKNVSVERVAFWLNELWGETRTAQRVWMARRAARQ